MPTIRTPTPTALLVFVLASLVALDGCSTSRNSGKYFEDDGPGRTSPDVANIPDAVPKAEPRAPRGNKPYAVYGVNYVPLADARGYRERGVASWYGKKFHGKSTSNGDAYDMYSMTAAHRTLPLPSYARVRNLENGRVVIVRVNDRGPFLHNRLIDLSYAAASKLGIIGTGTGLVEVETVMPGEEVPVMVAAPATKTRAVAVIPTAEATPLPPLASAAGEGTSQPRSQSPAPTTQAQPPIAAPKLFVQVGAYREWNNAEAMRVRLEQAAFGPIMVQSVADESQARVYRVRIGPIATVEEGDRLTDALTRQGVRDPLIVVD